VDDVVNSLIFDEFAKYDCIHFEPLRAELRSSVLVSIASVEQMSFGRWPIA
jgi:flagellar motor switch protein FliM